MTSPSKATRRRKTTEIGDYGFARVRDLAFEAVRELWERRKSGGLKNTELAAKLNRDPGWVSKNLSGPGNWTLRTFGEFVSALDGEAQIKIIGLEDRSSGSNYDAYADYGIPPSPQTNYFPPGMEEDRPKNPINSDAINAK